MTTTVKGDSNHPRTKPNSSSGSILSFDKCTGYLDILLCVVYFMDIRFFIAEKSSLRKSTERLFKAFFLSTCKTINTHYTPIRTKCATTTPVTYWPVVVPRLDCDRGISLR